jgi:hypothetical protein
VSRLRRFAVVGSLHWAGGDGFYVAGTPPHNFAFTLITMRADIYWIADVPGGRLAILGRPRSGDWLSDEIAEAAHTYGDVSKQRFVAGTVSGFTDVRASVVRG